MAVEIFGRQLDKKLRETSDGIVGFSVFMITGYLGQHACAKFLVIKR
jgi:hypothetical protein